MKDIREINMDTKEGQVLVITLGRLSCMPGYTDKTPNEVLAQMVKIAKEVYRESYAEGRS